MRYFLICLLLHLVTSMHAQFCLLPETEQLYNRSMELVKPAHAQWVRKTAKEMYNPVSRVPEKTPQQLARDYTKTSYPQLQFADQDIEALAFLVLMEAAKSAREDLEEIMAKIKAQNAHRKNLRSTLNELKQRQSEAASISPRALDSLKLKAGYTLRPGPVATSVTKKEIDLLAEKMKDDLDSMSEMGEMESLRLQMAMDRLSRFMSTLSNLLKKVSGTAEQITQNLK